MREDLIFVDYMGWKKQVKKMENMGKMRTGLIADEKMDHS